MGQYVYGQTNLQVLSSAGHEQKSENININFTIGEPIIKELNNDVMILGQGFQQAYYSITSNNETMINQVKVSYYPNPTFDKLFINYSTVLSSYKVSVTTVNGYILENIPLEKIDSKTIGVDLTELVSGSYIVMLTNTINNKLITKFKVVKL